MKTLHFFLSVAAVAAVSQIFAQEKPAVADEVFAEFHGVVAAQNRFMRDERWRTMTSPERERFSVASAELIVTMGERILADFPADPRRWEAVGAMIGSRRVFEGADAAARKAAWEKRRVELSGLALTAADASSEAVMSAASAEVMAAAYRAVETPDFPRAKRALDRLAERAPDAPMRTTLESVYLDALKKSDEAAGLARARELSGDANKGVAEMARNRVIAAERKAKPLDLKFPGLDGRDVDLSQYRGKVVLLDFWATWCVPCMEEMPTIKAVYQKYHAQGFEVIGITDDIPPRDPAHPRGTEKNLEMLKAFLAKENMPWPQLWDTRPKEGPGPKLLLQQFDIHLLPTGMLFDQEGHLFATDNHSDKLEANVRKLLGIAN